MSAMWQIAAGAVAPTLVAVGGFFGTRYSRKTGEEANQTADWSAFLAENREWTEDMLAERDRRIKSLEVQMDTVMERFDELSDRYVDAVNYIRYAVTHMDKHEISFDPPPERVHRDVWRPD